ncbi:myosin-10-like isoform X2 [Anneissia japonica]|uniref:myosin-10-like isoform X2 n=1 Tax=Anneissia japonica TaxID=1529436 RepID=UPI0014256653|nr:myosin-10-like isoform X2 [Anneissia japonica]
MSRDWENTFSDIHRLHSSHHGVYDSYRENRSKPKYSSAIGYHGRPAQYGIHSNQSSPLTSLQQVESSSLSDQTPALVALLSEKIENQNKMIQTLALQVKSLEDDRDRANNQVKQLHSDLVFVNRRLAEKGVDLETEMKLENLQREVKLEIGDLQTQMKIQSKDNIGMNDDVVMTIMRDLTDCKRYQQDDANAIRRDIESLRTRLIKIEIDLSSQVGENKEVMRKVDRIQRTVSDLSASGQRQVLELGHTTREKQRSRQELQQLRTEMDQLQDSVSKLESGSLSLRSSLKDVQMSKKKQKKMDTYASLPLEKNSELLGSTTEDSDSDTSIDLEESPSSKPMSNPTTSSNPSHQKASRTEDDLSLSYFSDLPDGVEDDLLSSPSLNSLDIEDDFL